MPTEQTLRDLLRSGLTKETITAAQIADATDNQLVGTLLSQRKISLGYLIPYFTLAGTKNGHWRIKNLTPNAESKYLQPKKTGNHAYCPPGLPHNWAKNAEQTLIITEGEKKALAATQWGFPTIGIG